MKKTFLKVSLMTAVLCIASSAFAEDAPVYDVDNFPPQFDGQSESVVAPGARAAVPAPAISPSSNGDNMQAVQPTMPAIESLSLPQRIARVEQQVNNMQHSDVATKVGDMQTQVQSLRGQIDTLTHQIQEMQAQQKKMYADLDKRLNQRSANPSAPSPTAAEVPGVDESSETPATVPADTIKPKPKTKAKLPSGVIDTSSAKNVGAQPNDAEEQKIYQRAYNLIKAKKYNEAAATLQAMLEKYPHGQSASNAHYWLGELNGLMGKNEQAVTEFSTIVKNYPDSPKLADAQLKLGLIYAAQLKWPDAKVSFKKVLSHYPGTASARLASEQLKQIKVAGH